MNNSDIPKKKLKNLKKLADETNINLFKKNKNNWVLRDKRIIVDECNKMKKKTIKNMSTNIKNISHDKNIKTENIKKINSQTLSELENLDSIINLLTNSDDTNNYIETYSN